MTDLIERPDGSKMELAPPVKVTNAFQCTHMVMLDGMPMELVIAVRYLLADRERIRTLLVEAKSETR